MIRTIPSPVRLLAAAVACSGCLAQARTLGWLDFQGEIPGGATSQGHEGWIEIGSFGFNAARNISPAGAGGGREAGSPALSEVTLAKSVDVASPLLFTASAGGAAAYPKVTLDLHADANRPLVRLLLENVLVSGFSNEGGDASDVLEEVSLNFTKITFTWYEESGNSNYAGYNLVDGKDSSGTGTGDSDNDGIPDDWESENGLSVGTDDAAGDLDGDGLSNIEEFRLGTDPRSGASFFKATMSPAPASPGFGNLQWNSVEGKTYVVEWSPDLMTPFVTVRTVTAIGPTCSESFATGGGTGFYRVRPQ